MGVAARALAAPDLPRDGAAGCNLAKGGKHVALFARSNRSAVGVDLGTSHIKVVELRKTEVGAQLVRVGIEPTPSGCVKDGVVTDPEHMGQALQRALKAAGIRSRQVLAAIAGQGVIVRHIRLPRMTREELSEAMKWEAERYIPFPVEEASIDFDIVERTEDIPPNEMEVMLVAAQHKIVDSHVEALKAARLTPTAIDLQPFAVLRALSYRPFGLGLLTQKPAPGTKAYVDIGAGTTDLTIADGDRLRFTRIVPVGGTDFTKAIAEKAGVPASDAENLKRSYGRVPDEIYNPDIVDPKIRAVYDGIVEVAMSLATELRRSLDYYELQVQGRPGAGVTEVLLTGGGAKLRGIDRFLASELGLPVSLGDPLKNISYDRRTVDEAMVRDLGPMLSVGIGLGLREVGEQ